MSKRTLILGVAFSLILVILATFVGKTNTTITTYPPTPTGINTNTTRTGWMMSEWVLGRIPAVSGFPAIRINATIPSKFQGGKVPLTKEDLINPELMDALGLTEDQKRILLNRGFLLVKWGEHKDFSRAYSSLKDRGLPIYVTVDSFLHAYHVQFDSILANIEEEHLFNDLGNLTQAMIRLSATDVLKVGEPALRNVAYFSVAMKLLDPSYEPPNEVRDLVKDEIELIEKHEGIANSPIFGYKEDYSQYIPRGHYTRSERLSRYFKAMMWYGRMAFLLRKGLVSEERSRELTLQASLIAADLSIDRNASEAWKKLYSVTSFFVGFADDYTPYDYLEVLRSLFGGTLTLDELNSIRSDEVIMGIRTELAKRGKPRIYGGIGACAVGPPFTEEKLESCLDKSAGMRFMGQRYVPDSYVFQRLVSPSVGCYTGSGSKRPFTLVLTDGGPVRGFPRGLDWFAAMGSDRALEILRKEGDASYEGYEEIIVRLRKELTEADWSKNLYWSWLDVLRLLVRERGEVYPPYMRSESWVDRQLQAALASWAELRHDTILYAKQSYTLKLTAAPSSASLGAVEPLPEVYLRLETLVNQTIRGLQEMGYLSDGMERRLSSLSYALRKAGEISLKELSVEPLNQTDLYFIGNFDDEMDSIMEGLDERARSTLVVADVHTDLNSGKVLEEAVGRIDLIVVAFPTSNGTALVVGPVMSYYEFKHPMADRLTDEKWSDMLEKGTPDLFPWQEDLYSSS